MNASDNFEILRHLPKLRRKLFGRAEPLRALFVTNASRPNIEDAVTGLFHSLLADILEVTSAPKLDYGYVRLWTTSFAEAFEVAFSPLKPATGLKQHLNGILSLTCPRFQHDGDLHLETFEVLFERSSEEYISAADMRAGRLPTNVCIDDTFLFPFGFTNRFGRDFEFAPGENPSDAFKSPDVSYAFNRYAPAYFENLLIGDYFWWVMAFAGLLHTERKRQSISGAYLIIPVIDMNRGLACCCLAFAARLDVGHKILFSSLIMEMARMLTALESMALDSRSHTVYSATTSMLSFVHDFLGLLHVQSAAINELKMVANKSFSGNDLLVSLSKIQEVRDELVDRVDALGSDLRTPKTDLRQTTIKDLATVIHQSVVPEYRDKVLIVYSSATDDLLLRGAAGDLADAILPFINNALEEDLRHPTSIRLKSRLTSLYREIFDSELIGGSDDDRCVVFLTIYLTGRPPASQNVTILIYDLGKGLPSETISALGASSFFGRLPSTRSTGGAGIVTAIAAIQNKYFGTCRYGRRGWNVEIPVQLSTPKDWVQIQVENADPLKSKLERVQNPSARTLVNISSRLGELNRSEEALAVCDEVVRRFGDATEPAVREAVAKVLVNRSMILEQLNRSEEALAVCDEVVRRFGDAAEPALREAVAGALMSKNNRLGRLNRSEEALAVCDEVVRRFGDAAEPTVREVVAKVLVNKGIRLGKLNRSEESIAVCDEVVRRFGDAVELALRKCVATALVTKGVTLAQLNRNEESIAIYDELERRFGDTAELSLREDVAKALVYKGIMLGQLNRSEEEIDVYNEIVRRFGDTAELSLREHVAKALVNKSYRLGQLNRSEEAIAVHDEVVRRFGNAAELAFRERVARALGSKGYRLGQLNRSEEAIAAYDEVVHRFGGATELALRELVAQVLINKGDRLGQLHRSVEADSVYGDLERRFGTASEATLRGLLAEALIDKAQRLCRDDAHEEAIAAYKEVVQRFGEANDLALQRLVAEALLSQIMIYKTLNQKEKMASLRNDIVARFANHMDVEIKEAASKATNLTAGTDDAMGVTTV